MTASKLTGAALFFCVLGTMLLLPPLLLVFNVERRLFGVPFELLYLFAVWLVLIVGTRWFAHRLPVDEKADEAGDGG
jgi:hypothetical protein